MTDSSTFVRHIPCPSCGSSDANSLYDDGHTFCFACGHYANADGSAQKQSRQTSRMTDSIKIEVGGISTRKIHEETAQKYGYGVGVWKGKKVQVAPYYNADGQMVAQHIRTRDKQFPWMGSPKEALPFGAHAFPKSGKMIVVTEGELDAMSVAQAMNLRWPVVSIGSGAGAQTRKYMAEHRAYFQNFEKVVLCFDMDEAGRKAVKDAAEVIGPKAHIADLPLKDANEMLVAGRIEELVNCIWRAVPYRPDGVVEAKTLKEQVLAGPKVGLSTPWKGLTDLTFGFRTGELHAIGAGTGVGKTTALLHFVEHFLKEHNAPVGCFFLEQQPRETATRLAGLLGDKKFHIPGDRGGWTPEDLDSAWLKLEALPPVYLYDSFGATEWENVEERIRYLAEVQGVKWFILDHLTALAAAADDEQEAIKEIMADLGSIVKELDVTVFFVSHLSTPDGTPHEEGGRVMIRHFRGSRAIGYWSHYMWGLERNQQAEDLDERRTIAMRCLKDRVTGQATGELLFIKSAGQSDRLYEITKDSDPDAPSVPDEDDGEADF